MTKAQYEYNEYLKATYGGPPEHPEQAKQIKAAFYAGVLTTLAIIAEVPEAGDDTGFKTMETIHNLRDEAAVEIFTSQGGDGKAFMQLLTSGIPLTKENLSAITKGGNPNGN